MVGESHGLDSHLCFVIKSVIAPQCSCRDQLPVLLVEDELNTKLSYLSTKLC